MLRSLYINNFAIIDEIIINFEKGLNIITGETGSGKSLIFKAIEYLLGKQFKKGIVRAGASNLAIEGVFISNKRELKIRRTYRNGISKSYINDKAVKICELVKITHKLADLHGQHDHQNLLDENMHIRYVDAYGSYNSDLAEMEYLYNSMLKINDLLIKNTNEQQKLLDKKILHDFQLKELSLYPLSSDYENEITAKYKLNSNIEKIHASLDSASNIIDLDNHSILNRLKELQNNINDVKEYNDRILMMTNRISDVIYELQDLNDEVSSIRSKINVDENQISELNKIINHIESMKRKYGGTIDAAALHYNELMQQNQYLDNYKEKIIKLENEYRTISEKVKVKAELLSELRTISATKLEKYISLNMEKLNMSHADLKIQLIQEAANISKLGMDSCEFIISTNTGEKYYPLKNIASGGEISRIMLAIKMALQKKDFVSTLIFDEIDSGISGFVAEQVGRTIEQLSNSHQIFCITHLSQIAGKGSHHYQVKKINKNSRNVVKITKLTKSDRVQEIASLISGEKITDASYKQAEALIDNG